MAILNADRAGVGASKNFEDSAQRRRLFAVQSARDKFTVEVPNGEAKVFEIELRRTVRIHV